MSSGRPSTRLRLADRDDARKLFEWANDPTVRARSISTEPIDWKEHVRWLDEVLSDPDRRLYILEVDGTRAGQIRFDRSDERAEVSVSIDGSRRGGGLGPKILELGMVRARQDLGVRRFVALVRPSNHASRRVFEKAGYRHVGHVAQRGVDLLRLERSDADRGK